jgi:hypothetical protein
MIRKLKYKDTNIEVLEGDIVKVSYNYNDNTYKICCVQNSDYSFDFGTAFILNNKTFDDGYKTIPVSDLIFIDRDFYDPDHF